MKNHYRLASFAAAVLASSASLAAGTTTCSSSPCSVDMNVSAEVIAACTSITTTDIDFGTDIARNVSDTANATVTANCSSGTVYTVELDYGLNLNGTTQRRVQDDAGNLLDYKIFQPNAGGTAASTVEWGTNATQAGSGFQMTGNGAAQAYTAYGVLSRVTNSPVGVYTDLVTVKMSY